MKANTLKPSALNVARFSGFIDQLAQLVENQAIDAPQLPEKIKPLLSDLVSHDDWLEDKYRQPHPDHYQQYLLYMDAQQRYSIVAFVWGPGQQTPIHDHQVWGLIGMLQGAEQSQGYHHATSEMIPDGAPVILRPGDVDILSPQTGDIHQVSNLYADQVSISIHIYGADIGAVKRSVFNLAGEAKQFISGYANTTLPNLWGIQNHVS